MESHVPFKNLEEHPPLTMAGRPKRARARQEVKTMKKELRRGQRIYYKGDMANCDGFGEIVAVRDDSWDCHYQIRMDDGRSFWLFSSAFEPGVGCRFMTEEDWRADRESRISEMKKWANI